MLAGAVIAVALATGTGAPVRPGGRAAQQLQTATPPTTVAEPTTLPSPTAPEIVATTLAPPPGASARGTESPESPENPAVGRADLVAALRRLPKRQREVAVLLYVADLPVASVAAALGCSDGTMKQHASRARTALRASLATT